MLRAPSGRLTSTYARRCKRDSIVMCTYLDEGEADELNDFVRDCVDAAVADSVVGGVRVTLRVAADEAAGGESRCGGARSLGERRMAPLPSCRKHLFRRCNASAIVARRRTHK